VTSCPVCGLSDAVRCRDESRFYLDGRLTAICFHGHDGSGEKHFYPDTGELIKSVPMQPFELFYRALETTEARGFGPAFLATECGIFRVTKDARAQVAVPFPTEKDIIDADALEAAIVAAPLYDGASMSGLELRRVEINGTVPGKWFKVLGSQGVYIANPRIQPKAVVIFEGVWDAVAGAWDAFNHDSQNYAFCAIKAGTQAALVKRTLDAHFPGVPVLIITDQDGAGKGARTRLKKLGTLAILPGVGMAKDYRAADSTARWEALLIGIELALQSEPPRDDKLSRNEDGGIRRTPGNLAKILRSDPRWGERLSRNEMTQDIRYDGIVVVDSFVDYVQEAIEDAYGTPFGREETAAKIAAQADQQLIHPVREMLMALPKHDGKERLGNLALEVLGNNTVLARKYLIHFFVGAVRRVLRPGLKMDSVPVLVGKQGIGKSTFWRIIASDKWFCDSAVDLDSKDGAMTIHRGWITELGEIDHLADKVQERVKGFLSQCQDTYRPPFSRTTQVFPRSCVIVGSTNRMGFLTDPTGSRRYWPIACPQPIRLDLLIEWRDQLLAEALMMEAVGVEHYLPAHLETLRAIDAFEFEATDPWDTLIDQAIKNLRKYPPMLPDGKPRPREDGYSGSEIMTQMGISAIQQTRGKQMHLTELLKQKLWTKGGRTGPGGTGGSHLWIPPEDPDQQTNQPQPTSTNLEFSEILQ